MLPLDLPPDTTIDSLLTDVIPQTHRRLVEHGGPLDVFTIAIRMPSMAAESAGNVNANVMLVGEILCMNPGTTLNAAAWSVGSLA